MRHPILLCVGLLAPCLAAHAAADWDSINPIYVQPATVSGDVQRFSLVTDGDVAAVQVRSEACPVLPVPGVGSTCSEVMLLERQGGDWIQVARLRASDGALAPNDFGTTLAVSADLVVVSGQHCLNGNACRALYVFARPAGGWTNMTETARVTPANLGVLELDGLDTVAADGHIVTGARAFGCDAFCGRFRPLVIGPGASGWSTPVAVAHLQAAAAQAAVGGYAGSDRLRSDGATIAVGVGPDTVHVWERAGATWTAIAPTAVITGVSVTDQLAVDAGTLAAPNASGGVNLWKRGAAWTDRVAPDAVLSPGAGVPSGVEGLAMRHGHLVTVTNAGDLVHYSQTAGDWVSGNQATVLRAADFPGSEKPRHYLGVTADGSVLAYNDRHCDASFLTRGCLRAWWITGTTDTPRAEVYTPGFAEHIREASDTGNLVFSWGHDSASDMDVGPAQFTATVGAGQFTGLPELSGNVAGCTATATTVTCQSTALSRGALAFVGVPWTPPATKQYVTVTTTVTHASPDSNPSSNSSSSGLWVDHAPVATGLSYTAQEWEPITGRVVVTDADGDAFTLRSLAAGMGIFNFNAATGDFTYTPPSGGFGPFPVDSPAIGITDSFGVERLVHLEFTFTPAPRNGGGGGGAPEPVWLLVLATLLGWRTVRRPSAIRP